MWEQTPGRTCGLMEWGTQAGAGLLAGLVAPWKREQITKKLQLLGRTDTEEIF